MKVNNKGFAFTVMLYSILGLVAMLMMLILSTMSGSKKNNSNLIDHIKDDLNDAAYQEQAMILKYTGYPQEYEAVKSGYYQIELWGASGGANNRDSIGLGAYTSGIIYLNAGDKLYFYVGESGKTGCGNYLNCTVGSYNGGGLGGYHTGSNLLRYAGGGGATDVRLVTGAWNNFESLKSRIMVAAGGGVGENNLGSHGGTLLGEKGNNKTGGAIAGGGGSQTLGGSSGENAGSFGVGGDGTVAYGTTVNCNQAYGGGGGYYGGGGGVSGNPSSNSGGTCSIQGLSGGGSSFISGYAGVNAITSSDTITPSNNTLHYSNKYFINGIMQAGVNTGDGKAEIHYRGSSYNRKNNQLESVRYIQDCINGSSLSTENKWIELQAISGGRNIAYNKTVSATFTSSTSLQVITNGNVEATTNEIVKANTTGNQCIVVDLGSTYKLDEVAVWHDYSNNPIYRNHTLSVSTNKTSWTPVISNQNTSETPAGIHFSAY